MTTDSAPRLHIGASDPTASKVDKMQRFLGEDFFDDKGLMYAMWFWSGNEMRPFRESDFEEAALFTTKAGTPMHDLRNYENSPATSGWFLWSQVLRYRATGESQALEYAAKAFRSLELIYDLGVEHGEAGLLCKPYGGVYSRETSPDQYVSVVRGLWEYREVVAADTRRRIDAMIVAMSDWWRLRDYKIVYFDTEGDWLHGDCTAQYGPVYIALHLMAYRISGEVAYRREADRILDLVGSFETRFDSDRKKMLECGKSTWPELLHGCEYDPGRRDFIRPVWETFAPIWFGGAVADWLYENEPPLRRLMPHVIGNYYRSIKGNLTEDLLARYWTQMDLGTGETYPLVHASAGEDWRQYLVPINWGFFSYQSGILEDSCRAADMALLAYRYAPQFSPGALEMAQKMLALLDDRRLHAWIDPTGEEFAPGDRWMKYEMSSEAPSVTLLTYWRARCWGIPL